MGAPTAGEQAAPTLERDRLAAAAELRILLGEDDGVNRRPALRLLEKLGSGAEVVVNGGEALEELRSRPYDVVLTDVEMPEMDGLETARRIHREWTTAERPRIIAMTANAMHGDREICLAAGMDDYVSKPVRLDAPAEALGRCRPRAVVDPGALERLGVTPADREFAAELVDALLREAPGLLQTLRGADARRAAGGGHVEVERPGVRGDSIGRTLPGARGAGQRRPPRRHAAELLGRIDAEYARVERALQDLT